MTANWTFGRKIGAGFGAMLVLCLFIATVAGLGLRSIVAGSERLIEVNAQNLIDAEHLEGSAELELESLRDYLLTNEPRYLDAMQRARQQFEAELRQLRPRVTGEAGRALDDIQRSAEALERSSVAVIALRKGGAHLDDVAGVFQKDVTPSLEAMRRAQDALVAVETRELDSAKAEAAASARHAMMLVGIIGSVALLTAVVLGFVLSRSLSREVGSAIQHVQSSSAELQAAATQQASASTEQAAAMTEIMTTIKELLATSHQIAESAQRVARIADQTTSAARSGDITVQTAQEALTGIKRQVDLIVTHMLELGKKSQQIGGILEIINELAEQTNILAINATIEAAGAGETGKRFGVVADEIRKLADRVGGSTKDIRVLIEEIRSAVNSTVMVTEAGTKAVDAGAKQFGEVKASLHQIIGMVSTTTEATREIELSTKQQTTAVEQVNLAAANVTQAARETEASSTQTLQTASQLATLSKGLTRLIQAQASA